MARKTKAEAALTRQKIIQCARQVFSQAGVSNTSMEDISRKAKVTRGAVYWHFRNKSDLFMAVRADTGSLLQLSHPTEKSPLRRLELSLQNALQRLTGESGTQETYQVMLWKCEFVGEFSPVRDDLMLGGENFVQEVAKLYRTAQQEGQIDPAVDSLLLARETFCFFIGLLKLWLADTAAQAFRPQASALITQYLQQKQAWGKHALTVSRQKPKSNT
jgi:TetR/AcrR family transcriptional regulator, acrAB operon repressor